MLQEASPCTLSQNRHIIGLSERTWFSSGGGDLDRDEEKKRILRVSANDCDKTPGNRSNSTHIRRLGALVGSYLNYPFYSVADLRRQGLIFMSKMIVE